MAASDPAPNFCKTLPKLSEKQNSFCCCLWHLPPLEKQGWHLAALRVMRGKQLLGLEVALKLCVHREGASAMHSAHLLTLRRPCA